MPVGLHVTLSTEIKSPRMKSLTGHPSITDPSTGLMYGMPHHISPSAVEAVYAEVRAQATKCLDAGIKLSYFDSHMWCIPYYDARFASVVERISKEFSIPFADYGKGAIPKGVWTINAVRGLGGTGPAQKMNRLRKMIRRAGLTIKSLMHVHLGAWSTKLADYNDDLGVILSGEWVDWMKQYEVTLVGPDWKPV